MLGHETRPTKGKTNDPTTTSHAPRQENFTRVEKLLNYARKNVLFLSLTAPPQVNLTGPAD